MNKMELTVENLIERLKKFDRSLIVKHHSGHGLSTPIKGCGIVQDEEVIQDTEGEGSSKPLYLCIY